MGSDLGAVESTPVHWRCRFLRGTLYAPMTWPVRQRREGFTLLNALLKTRLATGMCSGCKKRREARRVSLLHASPTHTGFRGSSASYYRSRDDRSSGSRREVRGTRGGSLADSGANRSVGVEGAAASLWVRCSGGLPLETDCESKTANREPRENRLLTRCARASLQMSCRSR